MITLPLLLQHSCSSWGLARGGRTPESSTDQTVWTTNAGPLMSPLLTHNVAPISNGNRALITVVTVLITMVGELISQV